MNGIPYKDTFAAKGSKLYEILTTAPVIIRDALAQRQYKETTERMYALTPKKGVQDGTITFTPTSAS
jgi:hypothetical protein